MDAGRIGFAVKGEYNNSTQYEILDVVYYDKTSWIAKQNTLGNTPSVNSEYWQQVADSIEKHFTESVLDPNGVHGMRYVASKQSFQIYDSDIQEWIPLFNTNSVQLAQPHDVSVNTLGKKVFITWTDPSDIILDKYVFAKWVGTIIVKKEDSAPTSETDGEIIYNGAIRNAHKTTPFVDEDVEYDKTYYYGIFPYTDKGLYTISPGQIAIPKARALDAPTNVQATGDEGKVIIKWKDPPNIVISGETVAEWKGTVIVRKEDSAPTSETDGTLIYNSKVRDAYETVGLVDSNVVNGTIYYYGIFPYTYENIYTITPAVVARPRIFPTLDSPTNIRISSGDEEVKLNWSDPSSKYENGELVTQWAGTVVVRKAGSAPTSRTDGVVVADVNTRNRYATTPLIDTTVTNGTTYYYGIFPYDTRGKYSSATTEAVKPEIIYPTVPSDIDVQRLSSTIFVGFIQPSDVSRFVIVCKKGSAPTSVNDGEAQEYNMSVFQNIEDNSNYYIRIYVYNAKGRMKQTEAILSKALYRTMTIKIDESNPNPDTCCTYADDAVGMTPGSDEWDEFFGYYMCLLKDGVEGQKIIELDENEATLENGDKISRYSTSYGDWMYCFPYRNNIITRNGNIVTITISTKKTDNDYFETFKTGGTKRDKIYIGMFPGISSSDKGLRSVDGDKSLLTIQDAKRAAYKNNTNYDILSSTSFTYLQALYIFKYKTINFKKNQSITSSSKYSGIYKILYHTTWIDGLGMIGDMIYETNVAHVAMPPPKTNAELALYSPIAEPLEGNFKFMSKAVAAIRGRTAFLPFAVDGSETTYYCTGVRISVPSLDYHMTIHDSNGYLFIADTTTTNYAYLQYTYT